MSANEDLLRPSLRSGGAGQKAIYSTTAGYVTAFFGGPFAATGMGAINSWRLGRLRTDLPAILLALAATIAAFVILQRPELIGQSDIEFSARDIRLGLRVLALAVFGGFWLLHKRYYRGMKLMGLDPPNPWPAAIACAVLDFALMIGLISVVRT